MNATEHTALVDAARQKFEYETAALRESLERARMIVMREEEGLRLAHEALAAQIVTLTRRFVGLDTDAEAAPAPAPPPPLVATALPKGAPSEPAEAPSKRGAMDEPLLAIARSLPQPVSAPQVWEAWNAAHPDDPTTRSTARGVLERHLANGRLELVDPGGRGSFNPKTYRVKA